MMDHLFVDDQFILVMLISIFAVNEQIERTISGK